MDLEDGSGDGWGADTELGLDDQMPGEEDAEDVATAEEGKIISDCCCLHFHYNYMYHLSNVLGE